MCVRGGSTQGTGSEGGIVFYAEPAPKASEREEEEELTARGDIRGRASPCPQPQSRSRVCKVQLDSDGERGQWVIGRVCRRGSVGGPHPPHSATYR